MNLTALSHYDNDLTTRFGDCILLHDNNSLTVYDCGHKKHCDAIKEFLESNSTIMQVHVVVSHNDYDHTSGVCELLTWLHKNKKYYVDVYTHQYLKYADTILDKVDDGRRNRESLKKALLAEFDNIKTIIETAQTYGFDTHEALKGTFVGSCTIAGPTVDEFTDVAAKAVDNRESDNIGEGHEEETVMNAASVQLKCKLSNGEVILLSGDASPMYMHNLNSYDIIQLPHHGQLDSAKAIFEKLLGISYIKKYLISDNTGSKTTSGGSDKLVQYMIEENYSPAMNTKKAQVQIPQKANISITTKPQGVKLGEVDNWCW